MTILGAIRMSKHAGVAQGTLLTGRESQDVIAMSSPELQRRLTECDAAD